MSELFHILTIPFLLSMFLAVNMGASGTAPSFAAALGSRMIDSKFIPGLFGIMVLAGALIAGKQVSLTLGNGLLEQSYFTPLNTSIILLAISISLFAANLFGIPQSTSQATVLAIAGAALALDGLNTHKLIYEIIPTWLILPLISFGITLVFCKWILPYFNEKLVAAGKPIWMKQSLLKPVLLFASCYVAFSIGANNVANAAAPIASLTRNELQVVELVNFLPITILSVLVVAPCFAIGSSLMGLKVTQTTGDSIVEVTPVHATLISIVVATLLLGSSITKGIPTSLVQLNTGAFIALSVSKHGFNHTFKNRTVKRSFFVWMLAPIFSMFLTWLLISLINQ